jgi:predicted DCC family thiol-disulfide oxidoreductase YuxK
VCGLCNGFVRFLLRRDRARRLRFASLQSGFARALLRRHGRDPDDLDTVYLVLDPGMPAERVLARAPAFLAVLPVLGGVWRLVAGALGLLPASVLDGVYRLVVRNRYRWFGRSDACVVPEPGVRDRFIEV